MATTKRDGLPEFWVTGLAKALVGENPCLFAPWIKGHYRIEKVLRDESSLTQWKADHTERLHQARDRFVHDGWTIQMESYVKVKGQFAIVTGKADLIRKKKDCRPVISDIKRSPRESDIMQVLCYMVLIPMAWNAPYMEFGGEVIYPDHTVTVTPQEAQAIKPKLFALVRQLSNDLPPDPAPSETTCRWCDVGPTDCPKRWVEAEEATLTTEF